VISKGYLVSIKLGLNFARISSNEILIAISDPYSDVRGATVVAVVGERGQHAQMYVQNLRVISKG
jgi:hypothetical protein